MKINKTNEEEEKMGVEKIVERKDGNKDYYYDTGKSRQVPSFDGKYHRVRWERIHKIETVDPNGDVTKTRYTK